MNQEKDETVPMEEEVRIIKSFFLIRIKEKKTLQFYCFSFFRYIILSFLFRTKRSVLQVKQQQIVAQINIKLKQMMMKKKMNQFILNQVHVLDGKNDVKQFVY